MSNSSHIKETETIKNFYQTLSKELLNSEILQREALKKILLDSFSLWGYQAILPAILENVDLIQKVKPEISELCFPVIDQTGQFSFLRPDLTIPIARIASGRLANANRPLRLCYFGSVFKKKNTSSLDQRKEIAQVGAEIIGFGNQDLLKAELEILSVLINSLKKIKQKQFKIVLSHTDSLQSNKLGQQILDANRNLDFSKLSASDQKLCYQLTGDPKKVLKFIDKNNHNQKLISEQASQEIKKILELEEKIFKEEELFLVDLTLRANTNYYQGIYFEVIDLSTKKTFGFGGSYNNLTSHFGKVENAVGFSLDLDFLVNQSELQVDQKESSSLDYALVKDQFLAEIQKYLI